MYYPSKAGRSHYIVAHEKLARTSILTKKKENFKCVWWMNNYFITLLILIPYILGKYLLLIITIITPITM